MGTLSTHGSPNAPFIFPRKDAYDTVAEKSRFGGTKVVFVVRLRSYIKLKFYTRV